MSTGTGTPISHSRSHPTLPRCLVISDCTLLSPLKTTWVLSESGATAVPAIYFFGGREPNGLSIISPRRLRGAGKTAIR